MAESNPESAQQDNPPVPSDPKSMQNAKRREGRRARQEQAAVEFVERKTEALQEYHRYYATEKLKQIRERQRRWYLERKAATIAAAQRMQQQQQPEPAND